MTTEERTETAKKILHLVEEVIESGSIKSELTLKNGNLRKTAPKTASPLAKYVHRMIQFYSGIGSSIPTVTQLYLQDFVDDALPEQKEITILSPDFDRKFTVYISDCGVRAIYDALDDYAEKLTSEFGLDPKRIFNVWKYCF